MSIYDIAEYYDENMRRIETDGFITTHLNIPSTAFSNEWIGGADRIKPIHTLAQLQQKEIEATLELRAVDYFDYQLLRDQLYGTFGFGKPFYIIDKRQRGKRHKVALNSNFMPVRHNPRDGTVTITFVTHDLPYAESVGTTADIDGVGLSFLDEMWSFGMGLTLLNDSLKYTHYATSFMIYNAGNVPVHPFEQYLKITISNVQGSDSYLELRNRTNGTYFRVNEAVTSNQTIVIDGPNVTINSLNEFRKTSRTFIELDPGWNQFTLSGADSAKVSFDFRFYYL